MRGPDLLIPPAPAAVSIDLTAARPAPARRRRWWRTTGVAGCVALLVVVAVLTRGKPPAAGRRAVTGDAAAVLRAAAAAAERSPDPSPGPGQARLVTTRQFTLEVTTAGAGDREVTALDQLVQEWIPADRQDVWVQRVQDAAPPRIWNERSHAYVPGVPAPVTESRGRCGDYYPVAGQEPCDRPGLWQEPTPAFVAGLPADSRALLARLRADTTGGDADPGQEMLVYAAQALERGLLPARIRAAVYRALALLPNLQTLDGARVIDGRTGVSVGLRARDALVEIVIDPGTGAYVGRCHTLVTYRDGLPPGTVTDATSLRTEVVGAVSRRP